MKSIRSYLLSRLVLGSLAVLAIASAAVYFVVAESLARRFDENLADRVRGFASILFQTEEELRFEFSGELMPEYERADAPAYFELTVVGRGVLERSESLRERSLALVGTPSELPSFWTAPLPDGRPGRYVARIVEVHHVYPEEGAGRPTPARVLVVIARGRETLVAEERELLAWCIGACLVLVGLIGVVSRRAVDAALAPARRVARALGELDVERLPERLAVGDVPRELEPITETSDALIRRVDEALQRERRTTAAVAHELRTPISELVTVADVALRDGRDPESSRRALAKSRDVAWRMGESVATLLRLARLHAKPEAFERLEVALAPLVADALRSSNGRAAPARVVDEVPTDARIAGDPEVVRIVLGNLIGNALHYTPSDGLVRCAVDDAGAFVIENGPVELTPDDVAHLGEPFWRKDRARTDRAHTGLGLALSRALADRSGLTLEFRLDGTTLRARLAGR